MARSRSRKGKVQPAGFQNIVNLLKRDRREFKLIGQRGETTMVREQQSGRKISTARISKHRKLVET